MDGLCVMNNVVHNWNIKINLIENGWTQCYREKYSTYTTISALISNCPIGEDYYMFVGALPRNDSIFAWLGAYGPSNVLATTTTSTTNAYRPSKYDTSPKYNVHWYNIQSKAFGFASTSTIDVIRRSGYYEWY
eukprot:133115_1